jgi:hypothetical protein
MAIAAGAIKLQILFADKYSKQGSGRIVPTQMRLVWMQITQKR